MGTIIGLFFATALFHILPPGLGFGVLLIGVMVFVLRWAGAANYGLFSVAVSALMVLLLAVTGISPMKLIFPPAEMTILGGLIALATFVLWPTWERGQGAKRWRNCQSYRDYFGTLAKSRIDGRAPNQAELGPVRMAARLARSNMEASFERLRAEPATRSRAISLLGGDGQFPPIRSRCYGVGGRLPGTKPKLMCLSISRSWWFSGMSSFPA